MVLRTVEQVLLLFLDIASHFPGCAGVEAHLGPEIAETAILFVAGLRAVFVVVIFKRVCVVVMFVASLRDGDRESRFVVEVEGARIGIVEAVSWTVRAVVGAPRTRREICGGVDGGGICVLREAAEVVVGVEAVYALIKQVADMVSTGSRVDGPRHREQQRGN